MIRALLLAIFTVFIGLTGYLYFYLGAHKPVVVEKQNYPELQLLFKDQIGPYHKINDTLTLVENIAKNLDLTCIKTYGEFLDNPKLVDADRLRSRVGCIVEGANDETVARMPSELFLETRAQAPVLYVRFTGSPAIGPFVVYPKAQKFAAEHRLLLKSSTMELYTLQRSGDLVTEYLFFLEDSSSTP